MGDSRQVGDEGETYAVLFLNHKGFEVIHRNWRAGKYEIDIIAQDRRSLVFVEVKSRYSNSLWVQPEDSVTLSKQQKLIYAAQKYLRQFPHHGPIRFDVISVMTTHSCRQLYYHPDAFFPMGS
jgi:putative endonuclease